MLPIEATELLYKIASEEKSDEKKLDIRDGLGTKVDADKLTEYLNRLPLAISVSANYIKKVNDGRILKGQRSIIMWHLDKNFSIKISV